MGRPKKSEKSNTKQQIFECAVELFMKYGYEGASLRDISKTCGIRESSIYHYFTSKEDILNCIYARMDEFLENAKLNLGPIDQIVTTVSPIEFFEMFFLGFSKSHDELTNKISLFIMKEDFRDIRAKEYVVEKNCREMAKLIQSILEQYKKVGKIKQTCDCEFVSHELNYYFLGMLTEWTHLKYEGEVDCYLVERLKKHLSYHFEAILT